MNGEGAELSWWDKIKLAITPKSHAEELVDQIYGPEGRGLIPVPQTYDPASAQQPAVYVEAKQEIAGVVDKTTKALSAGVDSVKASLFKGGILLFVAAAALIAVYAFIKR